MKYATHSIKRLLAAATLTMVAAVPALAGTIQLANYDLSYSNGFTPVSYSGNTVTFVSNYYYSSYFAGYAVFRDDFFVGAHAGVSFTGNASIATEVDYQMEAVQGHSGNYDYNLATSVDVLAQNCQPWGCYEPTLLGGGSTDASVSSPVPIQGLASGALDITNTVGGTYSGLVLHVVNNYQFPVGNGAMHLNRFSITLDTVGGNTNPSPVPELPPIAMMGLGMAALAMRVRFVKARRANDAAQDAA